jgi:hypothetical protein
VLCGVAVLIATRLWSWSNVQLSGAFIGLSVLLAVAGRLRADILESSQVLDTLIDGITRVVQGHAPGLVAAGVMVVSTVS